MHWRLLVAMAAWSVAGWAATPVNTVAEVAAVILDAPSHKLNDGQIAKALHKMKLTEHLDLHVMEELESRADGPKTAEELERLHEESEGLKEPTELPNLPSPAQPDFADRRHILIEAGKNALSYAASMPDFICTQTVHRYEAWLGRPGWELKDTLAIKLSYLDRREDYKLTTVNGHPAKLAYADLRGAITEGEFVSMLVNTFAPASRTEFWWDHWTLLRNRAAHVFRFQIKQANSNYRMDYGLEGLSHQTTIAGQHGYVYVDRETNRIVRIVSEADSLPVDFPVRSEITVLDYEFIDIGGQKFLLPLHAGAQMATIEVRTRNVMDFSGYRKFAGESTITYDTLPDEKDKTPPIKK